MDPVSVSIVISAPREQVFDYLQDIANHPAFTDHYLVDWHLTRLDSVGRGAGARFRLKVSGPGSRFGWGDVVLAEVERPHRIVELGRGGKNNRVRTLGVYELEPATGGATRITFTLQTAPATLADRLTEMLGTRRWLRRKNVRALRRLRDLLEQPLTGGAAPGRGARVTVAGG
ncbi:MAG TPA: SRPBCC family protein [Solirubrobacteraceae bacterium]